MKLHIKNKNVIYVFNEDDDDYQKESKYSLNFEEKFFND